MELLPDPHLLLRNPEAAQLHIRQLSDKAEAERRNMHLAELALKCTNTQTSLKLSTHYRSRLQWEMEDIKVFAFQIVG
jgi:hypothetical protein